MVSLGYFFQQKKLSLEAQESEAHGAFLRVIELMRSPKTIDHIEGVQLCGQIVSRYASPTIVNSAFMRMAETFRVGSSVLQVEVLRIIQRNTDHLKKIQNHTEFIRPIFSVMYSNDPVGRAITLRLLAAIAVNVPNQLDVHHAVRMALQSTNRNELEAALFACRSLAQVTPRFAEEIAADLVLLMEQPSISNDEKITILEIVPFIVSSNVDSEALISVVSKLLSDDLSTQSSRLVESVLSTLTGLHRRSTEIGKLSAHLALLAKCVECDRWEISRPAAAQLQHFFEFCASRLPVDSTLNFIKNMLSSSNDFVATQGVKCLSIYLFDSLTDHYACISDDQLVNFLVERGSQLKSTASAFAFAVYCRLFAGLCENQARRTKKLESNAYNDMVKKDRKILVGWMRRLGELAAKSRNSRILRYVLLGIDVQYRMHFPEQLADECLEILPDFALDDHDFERMIILFIRKISENESELAHRLLDKCYSTKTPPLGRTFAANAAVFGIRLRSAGSSEELQKDLAKEAIQSAEFTFWDLYRIARSASANGRHYFALEIFSFLAADEQVQIHPHSHGWIEILRQATDYEVNKKKLLAAGSELEDVTESLDDCLMSLMEANVKLTEYRTPDRYGHFKKTYLDIKIATQRAWELMLETLEQIRIRGMDMSDPAEDLEQAASHLLLMRVTLLDPMNEFRNIAERCANLYKQSFDADGPSLAVIRLYYQICCNFGKCLASLGGRTFSVETVIPDASLPSEFGVSEVFQQLGVLSKTTLTSITPAGFYEVVKELFRLSGFFLSLPIPTPRYFLQQFQSTNLAVVITPSPTSDSEFSQVINMDTRFTLKVECALSVEKGAASTPIRTVQRVQVTVRIRLVKSLPFSSKVIHNLETPPEVLMHTASMEETNFFSHSFVIFLGYPGIYRISIECELIDEKMFSWDAMQDTDLYIKVTETQNAGYKRRLQDSSVSGD